ncbi:MAG: BLUF domain-containing protein [Hyphomicrobiales bacterium]|nr:BLUF domain-containing protein [Hyphomicrobiales bacterium]
MPVEEVERMAIDFAASNAENRISGVLAFNGLNFFQIIAGEEAAIDTLFARISRDERHFGVVRIDDEALRDVRFEGWGMSLLDRDVARRPEFQAVVAAGEKNAQLAPARMSAMIRAVLAMSEVPIMRKAVC